MSLEHFIVLGALLFAIGLYGVLTRKHAVSVLMSLELMFNGINVTAVSFSRYIIPAAIADQTQNVGYQAAHFVLTGQVFAVFIITVAAAEIALGLAIVIAIYRNKETIDITDIALMKK